MLCLELNQKPCRNTISGLITTERETDRLPQNGLWSLPFCLALGHWAKAPQNGRLHGPVCPKRSVWLPVFPHCQLPAVNFLPYLASVFWVLTSSPPWKHSSSNENHHSIGKRLKRTINILCNALTSYKQFMNIKL